MGNQDQTSATIARPAIQNIHIIPISVTAAVPQAIYRHAAVTLALMYTVGQQMKAIISEWRDTLHIRRGGLSFSC